MDKDLFKRLREIQDEKYHTNKKLKNAKECDNFYDYNIYKKTICRLNKELVEIRKQTKSNSIISDLLDNESDFIGVEIPTSRRTRRGNVIVDRILDGTVVPEPINNNITQATITQILHEFGMEGIDLINDTVVPQEVNQFGIDGALNQEQIDEVQRLYRERSILMERLDDEWRRITNIAIPTNS